MKILVLASFLVVLALFIFAVQVPVGIINTPGKVTEPFKDKVSEAVSEAISQSEVPMDEEVVEQAVIERYYDTRKSAKNPPQIPRRCLYCNLVSLYVIRVAFGTTATTVRPTTRAA